MLEFRAYEKMPENSPGRDQASRSRDWVALEKIHGAQLVMAVRADLVMFGKRKTWLAESEGFFGWQLLREELAAGAKHIAASITDKASTVYFYGELFGGHYPHPAVPEISGLSAIQTGIWYGPALYWSPFDILVRTGDDAEEFLAYDELAELARSQNWLTPPLIGRGSYREVSALSARRPTQVPQLLGLPPLPNNLAEGVVIKETRRGGPSSRIEFKVKINEFQEKRFDQSLPWNSHQHLSFDELRQWATRLINPPRVASARSKVGPDNLSALAEEVAFDICVDLKLAFPFAYRNLDPAQEHQLLADIQAIIVNH